MTQPKVNVIRDFDGFFEKLVREWMSRKVGDFHHHTIDIYFAPYLDQAIEFNSCNGVFFLLFNTKLQYEQHKLTEFETNRLIDLL